jgi:hypothetical protein
LALVLVSGLRFGGDPGAALAQGGSLRFYGFGDDDVDRVKIPIDDVANLNDEPGPPVDVGATDFTIEFWVKGTLAENDANATNCETFGEQWIYGNIVFDRDRWEPGGRDWGISFANGRVVFGVASASDSYTLCGTSLVLDGAWHHVAIQRRMEDGELWIHVDGALEKQGTGPPGDVSYPGDEIPSGTNCDGGPCVNSAPFLVIGAEKHDAGAQFPSFAGWVDEVRFSNALRYLEPFARPTTPFSTDTSTVALYHFDEGAGDDLLDSSGAAGGPSHGLRQFGGSPIPGPVWSADTPFGGATTVTLPAGAVGMPEGLVFDVSPNPSLAQTMFYVRFPDPIEGVARIAIYDIRGRVVDELDGRLARGSLMLVWDGRGADGPAPPGIYLANLVTAAGEKSAKFVIR